MFIPESMAVLLGMPFVVAVLAAALFIVIMWSMRHFDVGTSNCTHDCNQGRQCTCGAKTPAEEAKNCPAWPFPCGEKP